MNRLDYNRRDFMKAVGLGTASLVLAGCSQGTRGLVGHAHRRKPNFVFILIDDLGWQDVGFMSNTFCKTPNIDRLAREGVVFTSAYANGPNCAPSRACIMSGQYSPRHGVYTVGSPERGKAHLRKLVPVPNKVMLDLAIVTIPEALKPAGYACGHFGKWHLGKNKNYKPGRAGDPESQGFGDVLTTGKPNRKSDPGADAHHTRLITDRAIAFMEKNRNKPFFCYASYNTIHTPLMEDPHLVAKYQAKAESGQPANNPVVAAMIETLDNNVGRMLDKIDDLKIADDSVIFFFSDNGGVAGLSRMGPLRGGKGMLYEGGIREPMIVRWPSRARAGSICDAPVIGIDFYPTIVEMAGAPKPKGYILDGESIVPLLKGAKALERKAIFWHFPAYLEANYGWKGTWRTTPAGAVRQGDWKLIEFFEDGRLELYNLKDDVGEQNNLAEKMPEKAKELYELMIAWRKSVDAAVPTKLNPAYDPSGKL
jgi:arylsulfatase A-like enzyme